MRFPEELRQLKDIAECVESVQKAQNRQLCLKEVKCLYELLGEVLPSEVVSILKRVINTGELKFADDDLVYGASAGGALGKLRKRAGVKTLTEIKKPTELEWLPFSISEMEKAVNRNSIIHFDLTYMKDVEGILSNTGNYKDTVTAGELRYIRDNWHRFADNVKFYYQRDLIKKLESAGFTFERHGGNHDIYRRGTDIEKVPRHKEVNESLAKMILRKWKL